MWKKLLLFLLIVFGIGACDSSNAAKDEKDSEYLLVQSRSKQHLVRAMEMMNQAIISYGSGPDSNWSLHRYYNPFTQQRDEERASVWMYTSAIEATNCILHALSVQKQQGDVSLYQQHYTHYLTLLEKLYDNLDYYQGSFTLCSYTQTKRWMVYGVNRGESKGNAQVQGIENVYDDQEWLIRELLNSYKITQNQAYLNKAEYLTDYVLDGWDATLDVNGHINGGITWGPGYTTKHACSNGPLISPLVELYRIYKDKDDIITYRIIQTDGSRHVETLDKKSYYLKFAKDIYYFQKTNLLRPDGLYDDMLGGCDPNCEVAYETIQGITYRKHAPLRDRIGPAISYNSGTMISGAADLYQATHQTLYLDDLRKLADVSFSFFAEPSVMMEGYYSYDIAGFRNWFNNVLMLGYWQAYPYHNQTANYLDSFLKNLDYAYEHYNRNGILPTNLLLGWSKDVTNNKVESLFTFSFISEYARLSEFELNQNN